MTKKIHFEHEYFLHKLTEKYLKELFDLEVVASEFPIDNFRLDTLAFDEKTKSFVIIEYKNEIDLNVIDQTKNYYELLLKNKEVFINRYNEVFETNLKENNFNFDKTRAKIIGCQFTSEQIKKSENPDYPFELYIISLFKHDERTGCITYQKVNGDFEKQLNIDLDCLKITKEKLLKDKPEEIIKLYTDFENLLLDKFDDLDLKYLVDAISIKAQNEYLCIVNVKSSIKIHYYTKKLEDSKNETRDISNITTGGPLSNYELTLTYDNITYAIDLIREVYNQKVNK